MSESTSEYAGVNVELDHQGFFKDPEVWNKEMAPEIAAEAGIDELTDRHWVVIDAMRNEYNCKGAGCSVRALSKCADVPIRELYSLFPKGPAKLAAKVAGIPKPRGCI